MKKKILFVNDERQMGGVSILLEDILKIIDPSKFDVDLLILHDNGDRLKNIPNSINIIFGTKFFDTIDLNIKEVIELKNIKLVFHKLRLIFLMKTKLIKTKIIKERKKILKEKYDVEVAFKDGFTNIFVGYGDSVAKISWLNSDYNYFNPNKKYPRLMKEVIGKIDKIVAASNGVKENFNRLYCCNEKTIVIKNLVNEEKIKALAGDGFKFNDNKLHFISIGRLHYHKSYDRMLHALNLLKKENLCNNLMVTVFGNGPEMDNLNILAKDLELEKIVSFEGETNNPYSYLKFSDLLILPSISEAFGLVIIEAFVLGVPVIATNLTSTKELIENDKTGVIAENSIEGLYKAMKDVILNPKKLLDLKNNLKNYKYETEEIIDAINRTLEGKNVGQTKE